MFELSDDWVWSDGEPVTSADVKFSLEDALRNNHPFGGIFWSNIASIETPEDDEVIINLTNPQELWGLLTPQYGPIVPKHIYEGTDMANHPTNNDPVVAGPYMLGEWSQGSYVTLVRNPEWDGDKPYFNRVIYRIIPDADATVAALDRGEVHVSPAFPPLPPGTWRGSAAIRNSRSSSLRRSAATRTRSGSTTTSRPWTTNASGKRSSMRSTETPSSARST